MKISSLILALSLLLLPVSANAETPTVPEALAAIKAKLSESNRAESAKKVEIHSVLGCYPIVGKPESGVVCLLDMNNPDGEFAVTTLAFQKAKKGWTLLNPDKLYDPACPGAAQTEALLRAELKDSNLRVTEAPDEGILTDTRGKLRDKSGPHRLMCTYTLARAFGESTAVSYFTFDGKHYALDGPPEIWN